MYYASKEYNREIEKTLRNIHYVKIMFGISQNKIQETALITDSEHADFSNSEELASDIDVTKTYETFENNRFILDGKNTLRKKAFDKYQGYISNSISGTISEANTFETPPKLIVEFPALVEIDGLTIKFDTTRNTVPTLIKIRFYNFEEELIEELEKNIDIKEYPLLILNREFKGFNKIEIEFLKTFPSRRRIRVLSLLFGITKIITEKELTEVTFENGIDLGATELPMQTLKFTVIDTENSYDYDNPNNVHNYLENGQPVSFMLGYELNNGEIDWTTVSRTFTTGNVSVSGTTTLSQLTFETTSILNKLDVMFDETEFKEKSLYELANSLVEFVGLKNILDLDEVLLEYKTDIPFPKVTVKEGLQLIANAAMCTIGITRGGQISIKREKVAGEETDFEFNFDNMTTTPTTSKIPILKTLISSYNINLIEEKKELLKTTIDAFDPRQFILEYETSINQKIVVPEGLQMISEPKFYCNAVKVELQGYGEIIINGNPIKSNTSKIYNEFTREGIDLEIHNPLINSRKWATEYMEFVISNYTRRTTYTFENRGYPKLDLLDRIKVENNFENKIPCTLISNNITYNGAVSGSSKVVSELTEVRNGRFR